jgi:hypothetical integral membrane protein (TIGR02206 family)
MFEHLFTYRTVIPDGLGWALYGPVHLSYLIGFAIACVLVSVLYRRSSDRRRRNIRVAYAVIVVALEAVKQLICLVTGVYDPGLVPLHLCGMSIFFICVHTIRPNKTTGELLYSLSLPGAVAALLFSDWNFYPLANFFCQQSFFIHFFEFSFPVMLVASGELRPRATNLWRCAIYLLVVVPPVYFFNKAFGTNFFFINEADTASPLAPLQSLLGNPGYLFGFAGLLLLVWLIFYMPWIIKTVLEKRQEKRQMSARATPN